MVKDGTGTLTLSATDTFTVDSDTKVIDGRVTNQNLVSKVLSISRESLIEWVDRVIQHTNASSWRSGGTVASNGDPSDSIFYDIYLPSWYENSLF